MCAGILALRELSPSSDICAARADRTVTPRSTLRGERRRRATALHIDRAAIECLSDGAIFLWDNQRC